MPFRSPSCLIGLGLLGTALAAAPPARGEDWPEWRGAGRRGVWNESGVLEAFPEQGLHYRWRVSIHEGHAGPAVAGGRVFVSDFARGEGLRGTERALALDEQSGKLLWKREWPVDYAGTQQTWANGPRATPTVDGTHVYFLGAMGKLLCLETKTGAITWERDFVADYEATVPPWGVVSAPIVHGRLLIALVGGKGDALVVALDKQSGEEVWRSLPTDGDAGYAPPLIVEAGGRQQLIVWHPRGIASLDPRSGKVYWEQPLETRMGMTVATPVFDRGKLLVSSFFDGAALLELDAERPAARLVWHVKGKSELPQETRGLHALIATPVLAGRQIYGIGSYGELRGLDVDDGKRLWQSSDLVGEQARWATGLIVRAGDRFFVNTDRGDLVMARFAPDGYHEIDRTALLEPTGKGGGRRERGAVLWTHPAYANRHVVVRNDREIVRASLEQPVALPTAAPPSADPSGPR